jgi:hypothetical protein
MNGMVPSPPYSGERVRVRGGTSVDMISSEQMDREALFLIRSAKLA